MREAIFGRELSISEIKSCLKTALFGQEIHYHEDVGSTNEVAKRLALQGARQGCLVIAERQSRGRGRLGRRWYSPEGGLWFSVVLRPTVNAAKVPKLALMAAVAVSKAISEALGLRVEIKWPNDILIRGRKVCGILAEATLKGENLQFVVLGVGLNVNINVQALPREVRESATSLNKVAGRKVDRNELLCRCLTWLGHFYQMFQSGKFNLILEEWWKQASFFGDDIEVRGLAETIRGRAIDVDKDGALILELTDGTRCKVLSGDILK